MIVLTYSASQEYGASQYIERLKRFKKFKNTKILWISPKIFTDCLYKLDNSVNLIQNKSLSALIYLVIYYIRSPIFILGDLRGLPLYFRMLYFFSKRIVVVDDGLSTLWFYERAIEKKRKVIYYTKYVDIIKLVFKIKSGTSRLLKEYININPLFHDAGTSPLIIIGGPYRELGWVSTSEYRKMLEDALQFLDCNNAVYISHPREQFSVPKLSNLNLITSEIGPNFISTINRYQSKNVKYFSFFSSGLIDCYIMDPKAAFYFKRLPRSKMRKDEHRFGFNVEERIYELFLKMGFIEIT